jgi:plastocyanin
MPVSRSLALASVLALAACGGGSSPAEPSPGETPFQMVITPAGVLTPGEITVPAGSRVVFVNEHSRPHHIAADPHPEHDSCPPMDQVGVLQPGQRRESGNFVTARTCGLHDHLEFENTSLRGRIVIR